VGVTDGDTLVLLVDGRQEKVRLYAIDAPEKKQAFGTRARQYASGLAFGRQVLLGRVDADRYGRTVGWVYLGQGRSINEAMVQSGLAWHYTAYSRDACLARLEREARLKRRGLWQDPDPVPPWEFRKRRVKKASKCS
jgi:endonuclease YncB( thermonuclease family)